MASIPILILAAGASTRMGGETKQLLPWGETTLLGHAIQQANQVSETVVVVLGAKANDIRKSNPGQAETVVNTDWEKGMGGSISVGVRYLLEKGNNVDAILIMLGDQPFLDAPYLKKLMRKFEQGEHKIVATSYGKKWGVPAIFDGSLATELAALNQDFGARHIIEKYRAGAKAISPKGKENDIDTLEVYYQLIDGN